MLREFLYVDVARARSFLAQLDQGVVETAVSQTARSVTWDVGTAALAIRGARTSGSSTSTEESKSLQDLVFVIFEDIADSLGLIRTVDMDEVGDPSRWTSSQVHGEFAEGEMIRVFTPVLIVDPHFLSTRFARFLSMTQKLNDLNRHNVRSAVEALRPAFDAETEQGLVSQTWPRDQRRAKERAFRKQRADQFQELLDQAEANFEQVDQGGLPELFDFLGDVLQGDSIYVRFLACGAERADLAFVGSLLGRDEYIQRERETLYSRYGARLEGWTSILQVARISTEAEAHEARTRDFSSSNVINDETGVVDRAQILQTSAQLEQMLEAQGIVEGPTWPSISVVPLAIYRTVPRSLGLAPDAAELEPASASTE